MVSSSFFSESLTVKGTHTKEKGMDKHDEIHVLIDLKTGE